MASWPWVDLPAQIGKGLQAGDPDVLGPLCAWLHGKIRDRHDCEDWADLAQALCEELRRLISTRQGLLLLQRERSLPTLLATVTKRLKRRTARSERRYRAALLGFAGSSRPQKAEQRLEDHEFAEAMASAIVRLSPRAREVLSLHLDGLARREIAQTLWPKRASAWAEARVKAILESARERLRPVLRVYGHAVPHAAKKTKDTNTGPS
jgi:DNA-directed RNA polymerase specialized sigma24 family protein